MQRLCGMNATTSIPPSTKQTQTSVVDGIAQHRDYLFYNALGRLRDRDHAEDAVQETFLAAINRAKTFSANSTERTWLTGILNHKVCDKIRHMRRNRLLNASTSSPYDHKFGENAPAAWLAERAPNPRIELELKELREALDRALAKLPGRLGAVFSLYEAEDWSGREICKALQISESNLWISLHRARKQLRDELSNWRNGSA
jgi:RNA polymerase sigma-70 factor (ECF subfamily)